MWYSRYVQLNTPVKILKVKKMTGLSARSTVAKKSGSTTRINITEHFSCNKRV
jgi:hypothetical protein